jgi:hypothetical protein
MIIDPIAIATQGVYSDEPNISLATKGYVDIDGIVVASNNLLTDLLFNLLEDLPSDLC